MQVTVILKADSELIGALKALTSGAIVGTPKKSSKKEAAPEEAFGDDDFSVDAEVSDDFDAGSVDDDLDPEISDDFVDEDEKKPAKTAPATKITAKDVNKAAHAHAAKHGRATTGNLIKKHLKVKTPAEIKPADYAKAIKLLKV